MKKYTGPMILVFVLCASATGFAQTGPCSGQSSKLACVIPEVYGSGSSAGQGQGLSTVLYKPTNVGHPFHFESDFGTTLAPLTSAIGRQANLLPVASPSSGVILVYDSSLKTLAPSEDESLGPILGERAETVGRHHLFVGFSWQFFNFTKLDGVNLQSFSNVLTHTDDLTDDKPNLCSSIIPQPRSFGSLNGCGYVRDRIETQNSLSLKENQYTAYVTYGLTRRVDLSVVIPVESIRMSFTSQATIVPGTSGFITPAANSPDATNNNQCVLPAGQTALSAADCTTNGAPYFFHLFKNCPNTSPSTGVAGLATACLQHNFPDPAFAGGGSAQNNSANGIGDVVARVKWNAFEGERAGIAVGVDLRFPTGDALNFLGSGSYGMKPFAVFSYRGRVSPHAEIGLEWNSNSVTAGDLVQGTTGKVPDDLAYTVGADVRVTKWLTGNFDIVGQEVFDTTTVSDGQQQFLANCGTCAANPTPAFDSRSSLSINSNISYSVANASAGIKLRPIPGVGKLVFTANVLVRLNDGGLRSKAAPLVGLGYTF